MHVQYVALCEQVIMAADGKPSLIGVFNDLTAAQLPITIPRFAFAARILVPASEAGRAYRVEVVITDPSHTELGRPGGEVALPPAPAGVDSVSVDVPIQFDLFQVTAAGRYSFVLHVDGEAKAAVQLAVRQGAAA